MGISFRKSGTYLACVSMAGALFLAGCSSEPDVVPSPSPSMVMPSPSAVATATFDAEAACQKFFELDLVRSTVAVGTKKMKKKERKALLAQYQQLVTDLVASSDAAFVSGELPQQVKANAEKMQSILDKFGKAKQVSDINKKQTKKLNAQSSRIEEQCSIAGYALPQENIDARELIP